MAFDWKNGLIKICDAVSLAMQKTLYIQCDTAGQGKTVDIVHGVTILYQRRRLNAIENTISVISRR